MDETPRMQQHDNLHKQITSYDRLLRHAMSRFSNDKLYNILKAVCRIAARSSKTFHEERGKITSIRKIKQIIKEIEENSKERAFTREEDAHVKKFMETYFEDLNYLKELKKNFDEKIYMCLYDYFYDPADDLEESDEASYESGDSDEDTIISSENTQPKIQTEDTIFQEESYVDLKSMGDKQKLAHAVKQMYIINKKWETLFSEDEIDQKVFDQDSEHDLAKYKAYRDFEAIFRLVPDIFVKAYKSIEIAKLWWTQSNKIYKELPGEQKSVVPVEQRIKNLEDAITNLAVDINNEEEMLITTHDDLKQLKTRENR